MLGMLAVLAASTAAASNCSTVTGRVLGADHILKKQVGDAGSCCALCEADSRCLAYTFDSDSGYCYVKDNDADQGPKGQRISGRPQRPDAKCTLQSGVEFLGNDVSAPISASSEQGCCNLCSTHSACKFFTFDGAKCHLKNTNAPDYSRQNSSCTSGYVGVSPPTPPAPSKVTASIHGKLWPNGPNFVCWNIDASRNRGFFDRNLSAATRQGKQLAYQAAQIGDAQTAGFSLLRFGGSGNDYLTYQFGKTTECLNECLNQTVWTDLLTFTRASNAKMIFGLSMNTGKDMSAGFPYPWDPSNAREILEWTIAQGWDDLLFGFELGNEQNTKYSGKQQAEDFAILHNLTKELWPDESKRPVLVGPDPHSYHGATTAPWVTAFLDACKAKGVPIFGATHHEYVEVDSTSFTSAEKLDLNSLIASDFRTHVWKHDADVKLIGGEIGPHNGGSPPCDHSSMRWANFGDSLWYADALASKGKNGYYAFCRQDYIGADYGLTDCSTGSPLPDYYLAVLWGRLMSPQPLNVSVTTAGASAVRVYAHCGRAASSVAVLVINIGNTTTEVTVAGLTTGHDSYVLSPSLDPTAGITSATGLLGTAVVLNGGVLKLNADGTLPALNPTKSSAAAIKVPATSISFAVFSDAGAAWCK